MSSEKRKIAYIDGKPYEIGSKHTSILKFVKSYLGEKSANTNSFHSNAVTESTLSAELLPFAIARDGIVEGVYLPDCPMIGIQWHPERADSAENIDRMLIEKWLGNG